MENLLMFLVLCLTAVVGYRQSSNILWYKVHHLFEVTPASIMRSVSRNVRHINKNRGSFLSKMYAEYSISSERVQSGIRVIVSGTFTLCVMAMEIVLWQLKTGHESEDLITRFVWPVVSVLLSVSLILVLPFCIMVTFLNKCFEDDLEIRQLLVPSYFGTALWVFLLKSFRWGAFYYTKNILTTLSIFGVSIMGALSGMASVSTPFYAIMHFLKEDRVGNPFNKITLSFKSNQKLQMKLDEVHQGLIHTISVLQQLEQAGDEIDVELHEQTVANLSMYHLESAALEKQLKQRQEVRMVKKACELVFLCYCVYKCVSTFTRIPKVLVHLFNHPFDYEYKFLVTTQDNDYYARDPLAVTISNILDIFLFRFEHQEERDSLTKQISLIISISLFIGSISSVTITISYLLLLFPLKLQLVALATLQENNEVTLPVHNSMGDISCQKKPSIIKNMLVSELTGVYVLSTILMIRSHLPAEASEKLGALLGENFSVPNVAIDIWFDEVFAASSVLTLLGILVAKRSKRPTL